MQTPETAQPEPDIISHKDARVRVQAAIVERLGADWQDESSGWLVVHDGDFLIRLNKGDINLDFASDLLGEITVTEREANPLQTSGRFVTWIILAATLILAFVLAQVAGVFNQ